jgi:hypothetical protein
VTMLHPRFAPAQSQIVSRALLSEFSCLPARRMKALVSEL